MIGRKAKVESIHMNVFEAEAMILSARAHGENGLILHVLTEMQGRVVGYVPGGQSRSRRQGLDQGARVQMGFRTRVAEQMGTMTIEPIGSPAAHILHDPVRLQALVSACALCDTALPERESHPALYHGLGALLDTLVGDVWGPAYVVWEIALMRELGYALDFGRCAGGGPADDLWYMSPKSGVAVSYEKGLEYCSKLLELPDFLRSGSPREGGGLAATSTPDPATEFQKGLAMTGYFLEHWVFNHHRSGVPEARLRLAERVGRREEQAA
jgi:DNA repair protein RecO (recombination protein O)